MASELTSHLALPLIMAAQAQKHVTHNEALRALDALVQLAVSDRDRTAPPAAPEDGDRHIVAAGASDAWSGKDGQIAAFQDGAWMFYPPQPGWLAWVAAEEALLVRDGADWLPVSSAGGTMPELGINTAPDAANRLAVKADSVLMSHDDVTPGSGDVQVKLNKASPAASGTLLFQSDWSGRAEIGLAGDDHLHAKVSADGSLWREALIIDAASGHVALPLSPMGTNLLLNGAFRVNQRVFSGGVLSAGTYGHDRWKAGSGNCSYSVSGDSVTLVSGSLTQVIENPDLAGKTLTLSVEDLQGGDLTISLAGQTGTLAPGAGRRGVALTLPAGATGDVVLTLAGTGVSFRRVKLEEGSAFSGWAPRSFADELHACQRYFAKSFAYATVPANGAPKKYYGAAWAATVADSLVIDFPRGMRTTPSMTFFGPVTGNWQFLTDGFHDATTTDASGGLSERDVLVRLTKGAVGTDFEAGKVYSIFGGWTADAEL